MRHVDHIIVGYGLAGATLAVELQRRGQSVLVLDRAEPVTSSKVAAGLMTPITGKRFALTPRWETLWPRAVEFYRGIEDDLNLRFFMQRPAVRIFADREERDRFAARRERVVELVEEPTPAVTDAIKAPHAGFQMKHAGRLDVVAFLAGRKASLGSDIETASVQLNQITASPGGIHIGGPDVVGQHLTFCGGFTQTPNPWFPQVVFEAAKGEMVTFTAPQLQETRTVHARGLWVTQTGEHTYRAGATYDWDAMDCVPTQAARDSLVQRLGGIIRVPFDVIDHVAAVRPIVYGRQPVVGVSREEPRIGYINGLGSKGALLAPFVAAMYADFLNGTGEIDPEFDVHGRFKKE